MLDYGRVAFASRLRFSPRQADRLCETKQAQKTAQKSRCTLRRLSVYYRLCDIMAHGLTDVRPSRWSSLSHQWPMTRLSDVARNFRGQARAVNEDMMTTDVPGLCHGLL